MTDLMSVQMLGAQWFSTHHASAANVLAGRERAFTPPAFALLVGRARRFTSLVTQMHLEVCGNLTGKAPAPPLAVFATCHGEIQTAENLMTDIRDSAMVSSARFALSVHNTPSGLYSVATGSAAATTTVTGSNALAAGWLEAVLTALAENQTVLLSIADEPVPAVFRGPREPAGVAAAFLLAPGSSSAYPGAHPAGRRAQLVVVPCPDDDATDVDTVKTLARAVVGAERDAASAIDLGRIRPGARLELRFPAQDTHA
jgi:hypothetical protein